MEPLVALSTPSRIHLSAPILVQERVDDWLDVIDVGEAVNEVISGFTNTLPTVIVTDLDGESTVPFEHRILYVVVDVGDTDIELLVDLSNPLILHLSALVLVHVRVDAWPGMIDVGEAVNVVTSGVGPGTTVPTVIVTDLDGESTVPFEHRILYVVVDVGDTDIELLIDLSNPLILHLSAPVLVHVRVDAWPGMIDVGEAVNVVTTGAIVFEFRLITTQSI